MVNSKPNLNITGLVMLGVLALLLTPANLAEADNWTIKSDIAVGSTFAYEVDSFTTNVPQAGDGGGGLYRVPVGDQDAPAGLYVDTITTATVDVITDESINVTWHVDLAETLSYRNSTGALIEVDEQTYNPVVVNRSEILFFDEHDIYHPFVTSDIALLESSFASNSDINITKGSDYFQVVANHSASGGSGKTYTTYTNYYTLSGVLVNTTFTMRWTPGTTAPNPPMVVTWHVRLIATSVAVDEKFICADNSCDPPATTAVTSTSESDSEVSPLLLNWILFAMVPVIAFRRIRR